MLLCALLSRFPPTAHRKRFTQLLPPPPPPAHLPTSPPRRNFPRASSIFAVYHRSLFICPFRSIELLLFVHLFFSLHCSVVSFHPFGTVHLSPCAFVILSHGSKPFIPICIYITLCMYISLGFDCFPILLFSYSARARLCVCACAWTVYFLSNWRYIAIRAIERQKKNRRHIPSDNSIICYSRRSNLGNAELSLQF